MIWAILALLGVPLWLCAVGITVIVFRNRGLRKRYGDIPVRVKQPGSALDAWPRGLGIGRVRVAGEPSRMERGHRPSDRREVAKPRRGGAAQAASPRRRCADRDAVQSRRRPGGRGDLVRGPHRAPRTFPGDGSKEVHQGVDSRPRGTDDGLSSRSRTRPEAASIASDGALPGAGTANPPESWRCYGRRLIRGGPAACRRVALPAPGAIADRSATGRSDRGLPPGVGPKAGGRTSHKTGPALPRADPRTSVCAPARKQPFSQLMPGKRANSAERGGFEPPMD